MANSGHRIVGDTDEQTSMRTTKAEDASKSHQLPPWIVVWFYITAIVCTWDASFIMCRPHSMPGESMAWIWYLYKYYVTVDQRYSDIGDAYVYAQSLLNYAEVVLNVIAIALHYRQSKHTLPTAFMVSVMTMWKTVLYFLMFSDLCTGSEYRQGNTLLQEIFVMVIPNVIWIFIPLAAMIQLWSRITPVEDHESQSFRVNGVKEQTGHHSTSTHHHELSKREVTRSPGSGLVQSGNTNGDILAKSQSFSLTSCIRHRASADAAVSHKH